MSWDTDQPMAVPVTDPAAPITVGVELEFLILYHFEVGNKSTPWEQGIIDQGKTLCLSELEPWPTDKDPEEVVHLHIEEVLEKNGFKVQREGQKVVQKAW